MYRFVLIVFAGCFTLIAAHNAVGIENPVAIAREARKELRSAQVYVKTVYSSAEQGHGALKEASVREFNIYFEDNKIRVDLAKLRGPDAGNVRDVWVRNEKDYIFYTDREVSGSRVLSQIARHDVLGAQSHENSLPDPRLFGLAPAGFSNLVYFDFDECFDLFAPENRNLVSVTADVLSDEKCIRLEYDGEGFQRLMWLDPTKQHAVLRVENRRGTQPVFIDRVSTRYTQENGLWLPSEVLYESMRDGVLIEKQVANAKFSKVNEDLDDDTFHFVGLDATVGTVATIVPGDGRRHTWNGEEFVPIEPKLETLVDKGSGRGWLLIANIAVVAILGLWLIVRAITSRRAGGPGSPNQGGAAAGGCV